MLLSVRNIIKDTHFSKTRSNELRTKMSARSTDNMDTMSVIGDGKELIFQFGMERDMVIFEGKDMESLRELAGAFIESKVSDIIAFFIYINYVL